MFDFVKNALLACLVDLALAGCASSQAQHTESVALREGSWVKVADVMSRHVPQQTLAALAQIRAQYAQRRVFVGSISANRFWLLVNGREVYSGPLGTGSVRNGYNTPIGTHMILRKEDRDYKSTKYPEPHGGAPMGFAMCFTAAGDCVHASANYRTRVSRVTNESHEEMCINCSHGCANLRWGDAQLVHMYLGVGDTVVILR